MSIVAIAGDCATTTTLALAANWSPRPHEESSVLVVEADPSGGSLAAWLDTAPSPSLSTVVTNVREGGLDSVARFVHETATGIRLIPAPVRALEATRAVIEAEATLFPLLGAVHRPIALVDAGDHATPNAQISGSGSAGVVVLVHRQATASARAAAVRVERFAERVEAAAAAGIDPWLVVIGSQPFDPAEIVDYAGAAHADPGASATSFVVADDPLAAAVLAGRAGVSAKRFARLPLSRSARPLATALGAALDRTRKPPAADAPGPSAVTAVGIAP